MSSPHAQASAPWADADDVDRSGCKNDGYDVDPETLATCLLIATDVLYGFTRRRWPGVAVDTIRPCGATGTRCRDRCSCPGLSELRLPGRPVVDVVEVWLDGVELDTSAYRVDDARSLVLLPGDDGVGPLARRAWPCCQDMAADPFTDEHTFQVSYRWGARPPVAGVVSAAVLGYEMALSLDPAACEAGACHLPKGTTSVNRDGITIQIDDDKFSKGRTGLDVPDLWLASLEVAEKRRQAYAFVPGKRRSVRRTA